MGTHKKHLAEALLMSNYIIFFQEEIRRILSGYHSCRSGAMNKYQEEG